MKHDKSVKSLLVIAICLTALAIGIYCLPQDPGGERRNESTRDDRQPMITQDLQELGETALQRQREAKWHEAEQQWDAFLDKLPPTPKYADSRNEAERNKRICVDRQQPENRPVSEKKFAASNDPGRRPTSVPKDRLVAAYPHGRKVRSVSYLFIDGRGKNEAWVFRDSSNFH